MCLQTIDEVPKYKDGFGWKVFEENHKGNLRPDMQGNNVWPVDEWIKAKGEPLHINNDCCLPTYKSGFHIFPTKREAEEYKRQRVSPYYRMSVRKVEYRNVIATGISKLFGNYFIHYTAWEGRCIVAKEMRILEDSK